MKPVTVVLLNGPMEPIAERDALAGALERRGASVLAPMAADADRPPYAARYVARVSLEIAAARPEDPLLLVGMGGSGPLLPQVAAAQRAGRRIVTGYVLLDALLPQQGTPTRAELVAAQVPGGLADQDGGADRPTAGGLAVVRSGTGSPGRHDAGPRTRPPDFFTEPLPLMPDWPDAPCGYLHADPRYAACARLAGLRGWPVRAVAADGGADALAEGLGALAETL